MPTGARVHVYGDWDGSGVKKAQQDLSFFEKQSGAFSSSFGKSMLGVGAAFGGAFAVGNLIGNVTDYLKDAATAAMEDEKSVRALSQAMKNVGMEAFAGEAEKVVSAFSKQYAVADDDLRPALQTLVTATGDLSKAQDLLQTTLDVSAATGKDLTTVSLALSKASNGNIGALTRLGIPLDANIVKSKDFAAALEVVNKRFGGQAAAAVDTYAGQLKSVQVAADEAQETIGYALLNAVSDASQAFGGAGGLAEAITKAGDDAADLVTGIGEVVIALGDLYTATQIAAEGNSFLDSIFNGVKDTLFDFAVGPTAPFLQAMKDSGEAARDAGDSYKKALEGWTALANGYHAALDQGTTDQLTADAEDAKQALDELKSAIKGVTDAANAWKNLDDLQYTLHNLEDIVAKNTRSLDGWGDGAKKNKDALVDVFGQVNKAATDFAGEGANALERYNSKFGELGAEAVRSFVAQGFKKKDIKEWLKDSGYWNAELRRILDGVDVNDESQKLGYLIGMDLTRGVVQGLGNGTPAVRNQAARLVREAEQAAQNEAEIQSPSKKWEAIGTDLVDGLIQGLESKKDKVKAAAEEQLNGIMDVGQTIIDKWDNKLGNLKDKLDTARKTVEDWSSSTRTSLLGAFDLGAAFDASINDKGEVVGSKWVEGVNAQLAQMTWFRNVLATIQSQGPDAQGLVDYLISQGVDQGGKMGQAMISEGLVPEMVTKFNEVQTTADSLTASLLPSWMQAGVNQAQANYEGFKANYGKGGPARVALENLMDQVARSLDRTSVITVKTVYEAAGIKPPGRATGGSVTGGSPYIIGERGPELFVPNTSGYVVPNSGLRSGGGGGNSYNITVQAGVGDPRQIGQQVVEYIKRFEKANGQVFAAA